MQPSRIKIFPILQNQLLLLRQPGMEDVDRLFTIRTNQEVNRYLDRKPPSTLSDVVDFVSKINHSVDAGESFYWVICFQNDQHLAGTICLWNISWKDARAEIGFELDPAWHRKGIMASSLNLVLKFAFESLNLQVIDGWVHPSNIASIRLMEKYGFRRDRDAEILQNDDVGNLMIYRLTASDYSDREK